MKKKRKIWLIVLILAVVVIAAICIVKASKSANKELVIRTHAVGEYMVENTVTATGTIEPVETVEVGTQVSGKVEKIYVDFNDVVKKGELLATCYTNKTGVDSVYKDVHDAFKLQKEKVKVSSIVHAYIK